MIQSPRNHAPRTTTPVAIQSADGSISVTCPALFAPGANALIHTMIERLFQANAVEAVSVDRRKTVVHIDYDRAAMDPRSALRAFSESLQETPPAAATIASHTGKLLRPYLDQIPGRVKRVERRRRPEGELGTPALAAESTVMIEDLLVEFDPATDAPPEDPRVGKRWTAPLDHAWNGEVVAGGVRRMVNLAAAGGCFVMSIVGVVTPGIPTVPFVLATGYFLAHSSPRLHERFRRSRFFGQMVSDYEDRGGLRWRTKLNMILFTVGLMVITVVIAGGTLPSLVLVGAMGTVGIYLLGRIPTVRGTPQSAGLNPAAV